MGVGQWNLIALYTMTPAQRTRFRKLRKLTHLGVGVQQVTYKDTEQRTYD